jgi:hypothetical protein
MTHGNRVNFDETARVWVDVHPLLESAAQAWADAHGGSMATERLKHRLDNIAQAMGFVSKLATEEAAQALYRRFKRLAADGGREDEVPEPLPGEVGWAGPGAPSYWARVQAMAAKDRNIS